MKFHWVFFRNLPGSTCPGEAEKKPLRPTVCWLVWTRSHKMITLHGRCSFWQRCWVTLTFTPQTASGYRTDDFIQRPTGVLAELPRFHNGRSAEGKMKRGGADQWTQNRAQSSPTGYFCHYASRDSKHREKLTFWTGKRKTIKHYSKFLNLTSHLEKKYTATLLICILTEQQPSQRVF